MIRSGKTMHMPPASTSRQYVTMVVSGRIFTEAIPEARGTGPMGIGESKRSIDRRRQHAARTR
jgi:hypothetical protein